MNDSTSSLAFSTCAYRQIREKQADAFTKYLDTRSDEKAYVANLNGAWGTGKTFFVDNWCRKLGEQRYVAIKIDAWESDYLNDPLALVTAELLTKLKCQSGIIDFSETESKIFNAGWKLAKNFLPVITMALGKHFLGSEFGDLLKEIGVAVKDSANDKSVSKNRLGEFGAEIFSIHNKHKEFAVEFKTELSNLIDQVCELSNKNKVYIFIDELDRCRPTYAIEMLEVIKHLFDIPKLVFVMSTDTKQLECSIKAVYGEQFDSEEYLSRFFQRRLTLSEPNYLDFIKANDFFSIIEFDPVIMYPAVTKDVAYEIVALFCAFHRVSLRRVEQLCARLDAALVNLPSNTAFSFIELVGSVFSYELYPKLKSGYTFMYHSGDHNLDGYKVKISYLGDPNGNDVKKALELYTFNWNIIINIKGAALQPSKFYQVERSLYGNVEGFISEFDRFEKCEYLSGLINLHRNATFGFEAFTEKLIQQLRQNQVEFLTGSEFEQYLHLFNDFS
ncbi:P-loop NTPase fold protein [Shewanella mangrovisoli]|uniref:KAP family P-loop NTPase fold protein n=1 Tax=Shewanella mangrovisoli TaxID=2864211 RepID=UPI0035BAAD76